MRVGFNHRYHPALQKARELVDSGALGSLMFIRGRYGHGGRVGYDREWRADPVKSGGGNCDGRALARQPPSASVSASAPARLHSDMATLDRW